MRRKKDYRWLRSDGTPNFDDRIYSVKGELEYIAKKPVVEAPPTLPIEKAIEVMSKHHRSIIVTQNNLFKGLVFATHVVNYLGGGDLFKVVSERYGYSIYRSLKEEPIRTIMVSDVVVAYTDTSIVEALEQMVIHGIGVLPVLHKDGRVYGVVTEHDLVKHLYGLVRIGVEAGKIMSTPVVTSDINETIWSVMKKMVFFGFRRIPVVDREVIVGIVTVMDLIKFFEPSKLYSRILIDDIRAVLETNVSVVMSKNIIHVEPDVDLSVVVKEMVDNDVSSVLIVDKDNRLVGIVTERDVLFALTAREV